MVSDKRLDEVLTDLARIGIGTFKRLTEGVTEVLRTGDVAIKDLDSALTGGPAPVTELAEQSYLEILALVQAATQEAREHGSATAPVVVQRAREILGRVTRAEPAWRPGPSMVRTVNDVFRMALRDLRASQSLLKLAGGQGGLDDLESLTKWADEFSQRIDKTQKVLAQPKRPGEQPAPATTEAEAAAPQPETATPQPEAATAPARTLPPLPVPAPKPKAKKKRNTTPKKKGNPEDIAFALAVAQEMGDTKVKDWAQQFADGKLSEKQWISRLTNHAAAGRDTLDDVFARATQRIARESGE